MAGFFLTLSVNSIGKYSKKLMLTNHLNYIYGNVQGKLIMEDSFSFTYNEHQRKLRSEG